MKNIYDINNNLSYVIFSIMLIIYHKIILKNGISNVEWLIIPVGKCNNFDLIIKC